MFNWLKKSLRNQAFLVLVLFSVIPLLILGITTNLVTTRIIEDRTNYMANQTIDKLSISISKDFQGFLDLIFYYSRDYRIGKLLKPDFKNDEDKQEAYYAIRGEINQSELVSRLNYPFHYIILTRDGTVFTNFTYSSDSIYKNLRNEIVSENWFKLLSDSFSTQVLIFNHSNFMYPKNGEQIYLACNIVYDMDNVGILIIGMDRYYSSKLLENAKMSRRSSLFIIGQDEKCLVEAEDNYYPFSSLPKNFIHEVLGKDGTKPVIQVLGKQQMVINHNLFFKGIEKTWRVVMITPVEDIHQEINKINYITLILILLSLAAIFLLIILINKQIISPVIRLNQLIKQVQDGNLNINLEDKRQDEIGQLTNGFSRMVSDLKNYIQNIQEKEKSKRYLEIRMLQSQINPHFVRNTLNTIRWMAEMKKAAGISNAIISFSKLLDYNFRDMDMMVTVQQEIEYLEGYIYLQRLRYQNKFASSIKIEEEIKNCKVLKLALQPIVENSIIHGLARKQGHGNLDITGFREGERLVFAIRDDGVGIETSTLNRIMQWDDAPVMHEKTGSIGIANVQQRIRLNFGDSYGIFIESVPFSGTTAKLTFPYRQDTQEGGLEV